MSRLPTGRHWFVGEGIVAVETRLGGRQYDGTARRFTHLHVFNPGAQAAQVQVTVFRANGAPPRSFRIDVAPDALATTDLATRREVPPRDPFWIVLDSDRPVFPQLVRADHRPWDAVPETLEMILPQPGPADATFTDWVYPDGFQGGTDSWFETETISLLNTGAQGGRATLTFAFRDGRDPLVHDVALPAAGLVHVALDQLFGPGDPARPPAISGDYATRVVADVPIVSQQTRRAHWRGDTFPVGSKTGAPTRVSESRRAREWFYGGGWIRRLGVLPRDQHDHTWQLLFSHSLDPKGGDVRMQVYPNAGAAEAQELTLRPGRSDLQWLHEEPWRARLGVGAAWGVRLTSQAPVAAAVTTAEYEPWSQGLPGAMGATALVPGPLASEWWLGVSRHGGADDRPVEWMAAWQLFNPGTTPVRVTLRFHGAPTGAIAHTVVVPAATVLRVSGDEVPGLPTGSPLMVSAVGDGPFLAHAWLRVGARGVPVTRALASSAGVPIALGAHAGLASSPPDGAAH